jgi:hypothetical protein
MNPTALESALKTWLLTVPGLTGLAIHEGTTGEDLPLDETVIVAEVASIEQTLGPLHRATCSVTLRSPALHVTSAQHATRWLTLSSALADHYRLEHEINRAAAMARAGFQYAGKSSVGGTITNTRDDRSWLTTSEFVMGIRAI